MNIKCLNRNVIIQIPTIKDEGQETKSGILIPKSAAESKRTTIGIVKFCDSDVVKPGDKVMFSELGFQGYKIEGLEGEYVLGGEEDLIAIIEENE